MTWRQTGVIIFGLQYGIISKKRVAIQGESIREKMLETWTAFQIQNDLDLYLADGGTYTEEQLRVRARPDEAGLVSL
jgi:hypothetical protein